MVPATPTVVPPATRIDGRIESAGDLVIEGHCRGEIVAAGRVTIAPGAVCEAGVRAREIRIHGDVIGNVVATHRLVVDAGARVVGDLRAPDVSIDADGQVEGTVDVLPPEPDTIPLSRAPARIRGGGLMRPVPPPRGSAR